jgi:PAS domain S-box-containing protein
MVGAACSMQGLFAPRGRYPEENMSANESALRIDPSAWLPETRLKSWAGIGILLALTLTGLMSFVTWQSTRQGEQGEDWVVHTFTVEQTLQAAVAQSADAENRARVFAATGNQTVLDPNENRQFALAKDLETLRQLTADNPSQQKRLDRLEPQVNASMQSERRIQDERERTEAPPSTSELLDDKLLMNAVTATLVEMQGEEARLLILRMGRIQEARRLIRITVLSSALTGVALLLLAGFILLREINRSSQMQSQVRTLEQRSEESRREDQELREANRALAESEERFRLLVEPVKDYAICMLDPEGRILTWNEGAERSKRYTAAEVLGRNFALFYTPDDARAGLPAADLAIAARDGRFETEAWRTRKDGTKFWGLVTLTALHVQDGSLRGFATVTRDMTAQKEAEESLVRLAADLEIRVEERTRQLESTVVELRHKNEEVEAFVYIVSHDLRAPLVNVMGFVREVDVSCGRLRSLIESCALPQACSESVFEILNAELPSSVHFISESSLKFERLIDALLNLSRYGRQIYDIVSVDVAEVVANAVATFQQAIAEVAATVEVGPLPPVNADMTALGQVFSNLIGNSLKYRSRERPLKLEIGGQLEDGAVKYWVRDNGLGIPESGNARLFQVFQRFHPQQAQGEGMGLAIVHRIVERHGGRIWAESDEAKGTAFCFTLPSFSQPPRSGGPKFDPYD